MPAPNKEIAFKIILQSADGLEKEITLWDDLPIVRTSLKKSWKIALATKEHCDVVLPVREYEWRGGWKCDKRVYEEILHASS